MCLFLGIGLSMPMVASAAGPSLSPQISSGTLIIQGDVTQTEPLYDTAGNTSIVDGENHTLTKNYTGASAALITVNGTMTINDLTINGNCGVSVTDGEWSATKTTDSQPLIRVKSGATLTLVNCTVKNNYSLYGGGGIDVDQGGKLIIVNSTVEYCMSNTIGGGIYSEGSVEFRSGNIQYNYAGSGGGGIGANNITLTSDSMYLTIGNTANPGKITISGNRTDGNGGGIYAGGKNNSSTSPNNTTYYGWLTVKSSNTSYPINISGNIAGKPGELTGNGGGIYVNSINVLVDGVVNIEGNRANSDGGGIYGDVFKIGKDGFSQKVMITGNQARYGGGISSHDYAHIGKATISGNSATAFGGGIYVISNDSANPVAYHGVSLTSATLIKNNTAGVSGGAIHSHGAGVHLNTIPCIKDNTLRNGTVDNVYLANNARFVMKSSNVTMTADSGEMAVKIGVSGASVSSGAANIRSYLTYDWDIVGGSITPADLFKSESERLAIGEELLNGEGAACYCFKITYNPNGGTGEAFSEYYSTEPNFITLNTDHGFTKTGHTLDSWEVLNLGKNVSNGAQFNTGVGDDYDLYAKWTANTYILTCDYQDGTAPQKVTATYGAQMPFPTRDKGGYYLKGWAWEPDAGEDEIIDRYSYYEYTEDKTVYAVWRLRGTVLTLDGNGGTDETAHIRWGQQNVYGDLDPLVLPTREGHEFLGYTLTKDGEDYLLNANGRLVSNVEGYTNGSYWHYGVDGETYELTLYAKWKTETYRLNYDGNGGTVNVYYVTRAYGNNYNLATPTKTGYTFTGWYLPDGSKAEGTVGDLGDDGDQITLTAGWTASELSSVAIVGEPKSAYYLGDAFDANGATLTATYDNGDVVEGIAITESMLTGFSTESVLTSATATVTYNGLTTTFIYSVSQKPISITFNAGGATGQTPMMGGSGISAGSTVTLPTADSLSKTGYSFAGWSASSDGQTYQANASFTLSNEDVVFTAVWKLNAPKNLGVNFDRQALALGSNNFASVEFTYDAMAHKLTVQAEHDINVSFTYNWYFDAVRVAAPGDSPVEWPNLPPYLQEIYYAQNYSLISTTQNASVQNVADNGMYYCWITANDGDNRSSVLVAIKFVASRAEASITMSQSAFTYAEGLQIDLDDYISVSDGATWTAAVAQNGVAFSFDEESNVISNITKAGGTFTVTVTKALSDNYLAGTKDITVTLNKAEQNIAIVEPTDTYHVKTQYNFTLNGAKGDVSFGCNEKGDGVQLSVISGGTVTVNHRGTDGKVVLTAVSGATDLYNKAETSITFYAQKLTATAPDSLPSGLSVCVGRTLSAVTLPSGYVWKDGSIVMSALGNKSATAVYTPEDTVNYNPVDVELTVTVNAHTGGTATCQNLAVCDVCNQTYGNIGAHTFSNTYLLANADEEKHYHVCTVSGCTEKDEGQAHIPNISAATEETAKYCTICQYVMEAQLNHTHRYVETVDERYLKSAATCTSPAVYYKSCACGDIGNETLENGGVDGNNHTGTPTKIVCNNNGTHDVVYTCCNAVANDNVVCTAVNADNDCTTAEHCACGYTVTVEKNHVLIIKVDKNDTHHVMECTNEGCNHEEDATHVFSQEQATATYKATNAICTAKATYCKSCACGHKGTETFEYGELDGNNHTGTPTKILCNNDGTHDVVYTCCNAVANDNVICTAVNADSDCTTAEDCVCGYVVTVEKNHTFTNDCDTDCNNADCSFTRTVTHSPNPDDGDCTTDILCSVCGSVVTEGNAGHTWSDSYLLANADEHKHYHVCTVCGTKDIGETHTPNIPSATEEEAKVCTVCRYVIQAQLNHTHSYGETATEDYLKSVASCTAKAVYYMSCSCGAVSTQTFEYGAFDTNNHTGTATKLVDNQNGTHDLVYTCCNAVVNDNVTCVATLVDNDCSTAEVCACGYVIKAAASHDFSGAYLKDENGHWHKCNNCAVIDTKEEHTPNIPSATEQQAKVCTECDYELEAQLGHTHSYTLEVAEEQYKVSDATCTAKAVYYKSCTCERAGTDTFEYGEKDMSNHTKDTFAYENNGNGTHTKKNECCGTVVTADETHTFDANDECVCGAEKPIESPATYTITVENGTADNGSTSVVVNENGSVTVTANAASDGKQFKGWSVNGEIVSTNENYTFNATADTTITAVYEDISTNPPVDTPKENPDGLSGGAIAGIVIACSSALAGGGFAIYWFVIRKKKK